VNNGLDFSDWSPQRERNPEILCVARCAPEKGMLEAAQAVAKVLPQHSRWRAGFVLADVERKPEYFERVRNTLSTVSDRIWLRTGVPFDEVKHAYERAAIALVPSKWEEPFGRTALEAHAGGAALISSGTGGLSEISGEAALMLCDVSAQEIASALDTLLIDEDRRIKLAHAGKIRARSHFDIRHQTAAMDAFLEDIRREKSGEGGTS
jgi:glycosyltransferase involved in cell wall biosynthesis